ncbi:MAG TPA: hypothetical protein VHY08_10760 [Bacillota bacterium]|nr:hypothetical protein [Bacillota bacterium]
MSNKRVYGLLGFLVLIVLLVANPSIFQVSAATVLPPQNPLVPPMAYDDGSIT